MTSATEQDSVNAKVRVAAVFAAGLDRSIRRAARRGLDRDQQDSELSRALYNMQRTADLLQQIAELRPELRQRSQWLGDLMAQPFRSP
jgi:hypothetical protein